jgi:hypothetical protein
MSYDKEDNQPWLSNYAKPKKMPEKIPVLFQKGLLRCKVYFMGA